MVIYMCASARDMATEQLPGPYQDQDARRYARRCLLAPGPAELLERENLNFSRAGPALAIPTDELQAEIVEHRQRHPRRSAHAVGGATDPGKDQRELRLDDSKWETPNQWLRPFRRG